MKKNLLLFSIFCMLVLTNSSNAQLPQYTLEAKNFELTNAHTLKFDLVFTNLDFIQWQLAGWQFFLKAPQTLGNFLPGFGTSSSFVLDTINGIPVSDIPESFRPRNPNTVIASNSPGNYEFRIAANSLPGCGNGLSIPVNVPTLIGRYKLKSTSIIDISVLNENSFTFRDSCDTPLSVTRTKINPYILSHCLGVEMTRCASHSVDLSGLENNISLNIIMANEGLYNPINNTLNRKESVTAFLRSVNTPYQILDSSVAFIDSVNLTANFIFENHLNGNYYIAVKSRNTIETWSKSGGELLIVGGNSYNFTTSASQAFGNNMVLNGSRYCIYSGNVNNDQIIDTDDLSMIDNDVYNYVLGNSITNLNGDNIVDIDDMAIVNRNAGQLILVEWPGQTTNKRNISLKSKTFTGDFK
ncbi:MAG TPA: hypothetical protein PK294_00360 [Ignavibacteria bacterium]|nr:hypothetical protein [Ignavibacteria bacterium]HQY53483.1 hypothetical protein [Ignavibacteria bacterium]HRA98861.1 hypothetical protein [Ignavibacteria bacterium]